MAFSFKKFWSRVTAGEDVRNPRRGFYARGSIAVNEDSAMGVAAMHRGIIYISSQVAKLPWYVKDTNYNIIEGPIGNLLDLAPNPEMNSFMFRSVMCQQAIIHGNSYAEIERNVIGSPIAMWPLDSRCVELKRTETGKLVYKISGGGQGNEDVYLQPKDVYHIKNFHTKDGLNGQGIVAYGRETLGIAIAADQMASGIFHNGGIPSGVLSHPGTLSDEAYQRIKASWAAQQSGRKVGGTAILEEGIKYEPINVEPEALQFLQSRQFGVLEVARFLGVPPTKLYDVTAATYSNVENANLEVATDTLDAWACMFEMEADVKLLNYRYGGKFTQMDLYAVFRGDMSTRANYFKAMMGIGSINPNEIRAREGMAPYKEGENFYIATNNFTPVDRMDEVIDAQIKQKTEPTQPPKEDTEPDSKELKNAAVKFLLKN